MSERRFEQSNDAEYRKGLTSSGLCDIMTTQARKWGYKMASIFAIMSSNAWKY